MYSGLWISVQTEIQYVGIHHRIAMRGPTRYAARPTVPKTRGFGYARRSGDSHLCLWRNTRTCQNGLRGDPNMRNGVLAQWPGRRWGRGGCKREGSLSDPAHRPDQRERGRFLPGAPPQPLHAVAFRWGFDFAPSADRAGHRAPPRSLR